MKKVKFNPLIFKNEEEKISKITFDILQVFEQMLSEYDMYIPDKYRQGEEDEACIFGDNYYKLEDAIKEILNKNIGGIQK